MMRKIKIEQHKQENGDTHHISTDTCSNGPCCKIFKSGEIPDTCEYLHATGVDGDDNLIWHCSKCRS